MQRFILHENLKKFRACLDADVADTERSYLLQQIRSIQRELALLNAAALGVQRYPIEFGVLSSYPPGEGRLVRRGFARS